MEFTWDMYLELAKNICQAYPCNDNCCDEAVKRCGVSRAYYAAFCYARNCAIKNDKFKPQPRIDNNVKSIHWQVIDHYKGSKPTISTKLVQLKKIREKCDYEDKILGSIDYIYTSAIRESEYVFENL